MAQEQQREPQHQVRQPAIESAMKPRPQAEDEDYHGNG